jgi:hypothetical protein
VIFHTFQVLVRKLKLISNVIFVASNFGIAHPFLFTIKLYQIKFQMSRFVFRCLTSNFGKVGILYQHCSFTIIQIEITIFYTKRVCNVVISHVVGIGIEFTFGNNISVFFVHPIILFHFQITFLSFDTLF